MRILAFVGFVAGLLVVAALLVMPYWRVAWILAASADAAFPAPPGISRVIAEDLVLGDLRVRAYRPDTSGRHPTLVMAHSFNPDGERDPRLAKSLEPIAASGTVLIVPRLAAMTADQVEVSDIDALVTAFVRSADLPFVSAADRGLGGYSWSAGYAILAAANARIRDDVRLVLSVGGFGSAASMFEALTSHRVETLDGSSRSWTPDAWAEKVARTELARRASLDAATMRTVMHSLSPIEHARDVRAPVALFHGLNDPVVPEEETLRLQYALAAHTSVIALQTSLLHHVNLQDVRGSLSREGMDAIWRLVHAMTWALGRL
jgi:dienelactone hydrolase